MPSESTQSGKQSQAAQVLAALREQGRRVRWERDPDDPERIIIRDTDTGEVIAIVRSLFEAPWAY